MALATSPSHLLVVWKKHGHHPCLCILRTACTNAERWQLVTTNTVLVETYPLVLNRTRQSQDTAITFLDHLERTSARIERVSESDERKAMALVRAHKDKMYSLCDAQSFVVMERLRIREAIAADEDFRQYGFRTLL